MFDYTTHPSHSVRALNFIPTLLTSAAFVFGVSACATTESSTTETPTDAPKAAEKVEATDTTFAVAEVDCAAVGPNLETLRAAADGAHRKSKNRVRNAARHPVETLAFFDVTPSSKVLELWPGGGWYTEVLAPYLKQCGELRVTNFDPNGGDEYPFSIGKRLQAMLDRAPAIYGDVKPTIVTVPAIPELAPAGSMDVVVTFRNNHGWIRDGYQGEIYTAAFAALKPGGILGVVQHRAPAGTAPETAGDTGYVDEAVVISAAVAAGFVLEEKSELNANDKDTKDHPKGVWTLPPVLRLGDTDKAKYEAIGESDRMTLRFRKPAEA